MMSMKVVANHPIIDLTKSEEEMMRMMMMMRREVRNELLDDRKNPKERGDA